jgi:hypothetical protein
VLLAVVTDERLKVIEEPIAFVVLLKLEVPERLLEIEAELDKVLGDELEDPLEVMLLEALVEKMLTDGDPEAVDTLENKLVELPIVAKLLETDVVAWLVEGPLPELAPVVELLPTVKLVDGNCVEVKVTPVLVALVLAEDEIDKNDMLEEVLVGVVFVKLLLADVDAVKTVEEDTTEDDELLEPEEVLLEDDRLVKPDRPEDVVVKLENNTVELEPLLLKEIELE